MQNFVIIIVAEITFMFCSASAASSSVCSSTKTSQECRCVYKTDTISAYPFLHADCTRMGLKQLPKLDDVEELDISHNFIEALDTRKTNFESFKIRSFVISFNGLSYVYQDFFKDMPNLVKLDLSHNKLVKFTNSLAFSGISKLKVLNLSYNKISTLPDNVFESLPKLEELDLSYNYLGSLISTTTNLLTSSLGINPANLTIFKLDGLDVTSITPEFFEGANNLKYLSLADNPLIKIPNVPKTLIYLDISESDITQIISQELNYPSLQILKLNKLKKLEALQDSAFSNLTKLTELHLNDCPKLKELNFNSFNFSEPIVLNKLYVARSGLRKINSQYMDAFKNMEYIDLQNNPWTCDCDILWLRNLNKTQLQNTSLRCASPSYLVNKNIIELTEKDLPDCVDNSNSYQTVLIVVLCCLLAVLAALIIYLIYLGPLYHKNLRRSIGPTSPYNENTLRHSSNQVNAQLLS